MKRLLATFLISAFFITSPVAHAAIFKDIAPTHPAFLAISFLSDKGVVSGYKDGTFQSAKLVTKAEALKLILSTTNEAMSDKITNTPFKDVKSSDWFAKFVIKGKDMGIVAGNPSGDFQPTKTVTRAEFMKMLLKAHHFREDSWKDKQQFTDVPANAWYAPYLNFAGASGIMQKDKENKMYPDQTLSRGEVAESLYMMILILKANDPAFLVKQAEAHLVQIETYMNDANLLLAKRTSEIAVDLTQQALSQKANDTVVLSAAKIAKAYDAVLNAFIAGVNKDKKTATDNIALARTKAEEAVKINKDISSIADHIKKRAQEIEDQVKKL